MTPGDLDALRVCCFDHKLAANDFGAEHRLQVPALRDQAERWRAVHRQLDGEVTRYLLLGAFLGLVIVSFTGRLNAATCLLGGVVLGLGLGPWFMSRMSRRKAEFHEQTADKLEVDDIRCCLGFYDRPTWQHPSKPGHFRNMQYEAVPDEILAKATPAIAGLIRSAHRRQADR